jgi:phage-related protein
MANIKGITIDIGGNTSKLEDALKNVNKVVYSTNTELRQLNQALKLDPKNTEILSQKQDVLKSNIKATTDRLNALKEAQKQMGSYSSLTEEQKEKYRALSVEIVKGESALKKMNNELKSQSSIDFSKVKDGLSKVGDVALNVSKKLATVTAGITGALAGVVGAGVKSYADLEQNLGGVETLFKDSSDKVVENAKNAYKTAGVSANEYMQGVTSFSASLLQSLGGDTSKAADVADMAFRDMSDNANKFGTDMASIQTAYQGFAKQNYTMLDNLKLGYGGTKTEMQRLLSDAEKLTGVHYDISNLSDVYNAIHAIQVNMDVSGYSADQLKDKLKNMSLTQDELKKVATDMGISYEEAFNKMQNGTLSVRDAQVLLGTTAKEAELTISGSVASMKSAFDNFLNGSGSAEDLADTVTNVLTNVSDAIVKLAPNILSGIVTLVEKLLPQVAKILVDLVPQLLDAVSNMIDSLLNMVTQDLSGLQETLTLLVNKIVEFFTTNLPKIIELGLQLIIALAKGIAESLPTLIPQIIDCVLKIVEVLVDNIDLIIDAGIQLIIGLIEGLTDPDTIEKLMETIPILIIKIVEAVIKSLPKIIEAGARILLSLGQGIMTYYGKIGEWMSNIINAIKEKIGNLGSKAIEWGKDMIQGFIDGIKKMIGKVGDAVKGVADKIKNFLHFSRPDIGPLRNYETWMPDMIKGMVKGINKSSYLLENATDRMAQKMANKLSFDDLVGNTTRAMKTLNYGVQNSLNPMVNPNANSLLLERQNQNSSSGSEGKDGFTAIINNNSKYTSPSENVRLLRQEYELYKLKYGGVR